MKATIEKSGVARQILLIPEIVELDEADAARLMARAEELARFGLVIETFGPGAVAVRETPSMLGDVDVRGLINDLAEHIAEWDDSLPLERRLMHVSATMAWLRMPRLRASNPRRLHLTVRAPVAAVAARGRRVERRVTWHQVRAPDALRRDPAPRPRARRRARPVGLAASAASSGGAGSRSSPYDADPDVDVAGLEAELRLGAWDDAAARRGRAAREEPRRAGRRPQPSSPPRARGVPGHLRDRARRAAAAEPVHRRHRARTGRRRRPRCSARSWRRPAVPVEVAGNIGRPLTSLVGHAVAGRMDRVRAVLVPARGRRRRSRPRVAVLTNLEPDHLDRHGDLRRVRGREAPRRSSARARTTSRSCRGASAPFPGNARARSSSRPTTRCRRSRASAARTTARTQPPRRPPPARSAFRTTRSPSALRAFPGGRAPHRGGRYRRRRPLRQRLEGDERRRRAPRARVVRRAAKARDPRRARQGRAVRCARRARSSRATAPT